MPWSTQFYSVKYSAFCNDWAVFQNRGLMSTSIKEVLRKFHKITDCRKYKQLERNPKWNPWVSPRPPCESIKCLRFALPCFDKVGLVGYHITCELQFVFCSVENICVRLYNVQPKHNPFNMIPFCPAFMVGKAWPVTEHKMVGLSFRHSATQVITCRI